MLFTVWPLLRIYLFVAMPYKVLLLFLSFSEHRDKRVQPLHVLLLWQSDWNCSAYKYLLDGMSKTIPSANKTKDFVKCNFNAKTVELTKGTEYIVCAFSADAIQLTVAELRKIKSYNRTIVKRA